MKLRRHWKKRIEKTENDIGSAYGRRKIEILRHGHDRPRKDIGNPLARKKGTSSSQFKEEERGVGERTSSQGSCTILEQIVALFLTARHVLLFVLD
jgi:hypothetical protein